MPLPKSVWCDYRYGVDVRSSFIPILTVCEPFPDRIERTQNLQKTTLLVEVLLENPGSIGGSFLNSVNRQFFRV